MLTELNAGTVEITEDKRAHIKTAAQAREVAKIAGAEFLHLSDEEIQEISKHPVQKLILGCLIRIDLGARTSAVNREMRPDRSFADAEGATDTLTRFYNNSDLNEGLTGVEVNHVGQPYSYIPEMARDKAKLLEAASSFFAEDQRVELVEEAQSILAETWEKLPDDHQTKPLIAIEYQLLGETIDKRVDAARLYDDMLSVAERSEGNIARIATVSAWVQSFAERNDHDWLKDEAQTLFRKCLESDPGLKHYIRDARIKKTIKNTRDFVFRKVPDAVIPAERKQNLLNTLTGK